MENGGVGKKREYNTCKRLQQQAQHLLLLVEQEKRGLHEAHHTHLLLAEVILQHRVLFKLLRPLQDSQVQQQQEANGSLPAAPVLDRNWLHLLQMAQSSSTLLSGALEATPEQIKALAALTAEDIRQYITVTANKLLLLLELLSPDRYPEALISKQPLTDTAQAASNTNSSDSSLTPELEQAAEQLLSRLQEFRCVVEDMSKTTLLLTLHAAPALMAAASTNVMTGQTTTPPSAHYAQAVHRLRLTSRQVQHFQLMLKQYNRITQQQAQAGQQLVGLSENSFSLAVAVSAQENGSGAAVSKNGFGAAVSKLQPEGSSRPAAGELPASSDKAHEQTGPGVASAAAADDGHSTTASLEDLFEQHLLDREDILKLVSVWAMNPLSMWQVGEWIVAGYPYFSYSLAFIELSAFLKPCDEPRSYINAGCCEAAAKAAAVAAEIGYLDTHPFMQQRCEALEAQLQWAMQEAQDAN